MTSGHHSSTPTLFFSTNRWTCHTPTKQFKSTIQLFCASVPRVPLSILNTAIMQQHRGQLNYVRAGRECVTLLQIEYWMRLAGMHSWRDAIGNVHGELRGAQASPSALLFGSHYDTVKDAGAYDGPLGIVTAIAAVKAHVATSADCVPTDAGVESSTNFL